MKRSYILILTVIIANSAFAVTSQVTRHTSAADLLKGQTENVIIDSQGTIELARQSTELDLGGLLDETWTVNCIVADSKGNIYIGTSPNGRIIKYTGSKATVIYQPTISAEEKHNNDEINAANGQHEILNEHVFAMAIDAGNRLLAAISGSDCRLIRFDKNKPTTIYQPEDADYILSIATDEVGNIFLGTGPDGKIFRLDPFGQNPTLVYQCRDNNILSLAVDSNGFIYAGSDQRGLVYKIDQKTNKASVLFDSQQKEVTSLLLDTDNNLYATATSALADNNQKTFSSITQDSASGRPESSQSEGSEEKSSTKTLKTPNSKPQNNNNNTKQEQAKRGERPSSASHIYKIDPQGFVTDVFSEAAVFFALAKENNSLLLGTGNKAELFAIDLETETKSLACEHKTASQITAVTVMNDRVYLGTSNPAKLIELSTSLSEKGTYISEPVDASQPAQWGKLQLDADIPDGCNILLSARSGNVKDPNDPTFSDWTEDIEITHATQLNCPIGRYLQYRLTLETTDNSLTPVVREVAIPHVVPNLPPKVTDIKTTLAKDNNPGLMLVEYKAEDSNNDKLSYTIELRQLGRQQWIKIEENIVTDNFKWDTKTVEDGEYEIRVTADDKLSNTPTTKLSATRVSDPFIVDNSAPEIVTQQTAISNDTATLKLGISDRLTIIGSVSYTVDSSKEWTSTIPDDFVYDTTSEDFTIVVSDLEAGEHVIAVCLKDDIGNTAYKTFVVEIQ